MWKSWLLSSEGAIFIAYVVVQIVSGINLKGASRVVCLIPALPMTFITFLEIVYWGTVYSGYLLTIASSFALIFVFLVWLLSWLTKRATAA